MRETPYDEQEMTINVYAPQVTGEAEIFCAIPYWIKRLRKLAKAHDNIVCRETDDGIFMTVPSDWIKVKPPRQSIVSDESRAALAENMRRYNETRKQEKEAAAGD